MAPRPSLPGLGTPSRLLTRQLAAAHCGLPIQTFSKLVRASIFPSPDAGTDGWQPELLDRSIELLHRDGLPWKGSIKKSDYRPLPYTAVVWRKRVDEAPPRPHPLNSPAYFVEWLKCERNYASRHPPSQPSDPYLYAEAHERGRQRQAGAGARHRDTSIESLPLHPAQQQTAVVPSQPLSMRRPALSAIRPNPRRGLSREEAAMYVGVSAGKFDELVADGRMPAPRRIDRRKVWDVRDLDVAFDALPSENPHSEGSTWDDFRAP
jgi:excisionase family DNA binding protein